MSSTTTLAKSQARTARKSNPPAPGAELAGLLDSVSTALLKVMTFSPDDADICATWCVHTWCFDRFDHTPRLQITSPMRNCGKTTLLECIRRLTCEPVFTGNATSATLFRIIKNRPKTLLIDEADSFLVRNEELRNIVNLGYSRFGNKVLRCGGATEKFAVEEFPTFSPMAIGGIGALAGTNESRAITIRLRRKHGESKRKLSDKAVVAEYEKLRDGIRGWVGMHVDSLNLMPPSLGHPDDRKNDIAAPLISIGDAAGPAWGKRIRAALLRVIGIGSDGDEWGGLLLRDARDAFAARGYPDEIRCSDLHAYLVAEGNERWQEYTPDERRQPPGQLTKIHLGKLLKSFQIYSHPERSGSSVAKVYGLASFRDAWAAYLESEGA